MATNYTNLSLPTSLVEELEIWKMAFSATYGVEMSYADIICSMLDTLEEGDPAVLEEMERLMMERPELKNKIYVYRDGETNNNEGGDTNK